MSCRRSLSSGDIAPSRVSVPATTKSQGMRAEIARVSHDQASLDGWIVRPDTSAERKRGRGWGRRTHAMAQQLSELVEQFCNFQRKQRGKTEGGVNTYRWILEQFMVFVRNREGRLARAKDLTPIII